MESMILFIVVPVAVAVLAMELYDFTGGWSLKIIDRAASRLPEEVRERYIEEWSAHLEQVPGKLRRLIAAFAIAWGAIGVGKTVAVPVAAGQRASGGWFASAANVAVSLRAYSKVVVATKGEALSLIALTTTGALGLGFSTTKWIIPAVVSATSGWLF